MNPIKTYRYVAFRGTAYSDEAEHIRNLSIAKRLSDTKFAQYVNREELIYSDDGTLDYCTYYDCSGLMVDHKDYKLLQDLGVKDLTTKEIYEGDISKYAKLGLWLAFVSVVTWQGILAYLLLK